MAVNQSDAMIARLESELEERNSFIQVTIGNAQDADRDLTDNETELLTSAKARVDNLRSQLDTLHDARQTTMQARERAAQVNRELIKMRDEVDSGPVEYRSAGAYLLDTYNAHLGDRDASERLEVFTRAAAHQKTSDNAGLIPDPIVGPVINFIDSARPLVSLLGPRDMPSQTWSRPKVTQRTSTAVQGSAGAQADEKTELVSQKMTITKLQATAVTYGGYVNVSRQNIDFSSPAAMDVIVNDLAAQYAIDTEGATGAALFATANETEIIGAAGGTATADNLVEALWSAVGSIYTATQGQGRVVLAVGPGKLGAWGRLFAPINPQNAQSTGFNAGDFGQGIMGFISGIPVVMSASIPTGTATEFGTLFSTAAVEVYEQRVGTLSVVEPSVLGVQVAYAGYFTPMILETGGVRRLVNEAA